MMRARAAARGDAAAIAAIYNQGIEDRVATFETRPRSPEEGMGDGNPFVRIGVGQPDGVRRGGGDERFDAQLAQ